MKSRQFLKGASFITDHFKFARNVLMDIFFSSDPKWVGDRQSANVDLEMDGPHISFAIERRCQIAKKKIHDDNMTRLLMQLL